MCNHNYTWRHALVPGCHDIAVICVAHSPIDGLARFGRRHCGRMPLLRANVAQSVRPTSSSSTLSRTLLPEPPHQHGSQPGRLSGPSGFRRWSQKRCKRQIPGATVTHGTARCSFTHG